MSTDEFTQRLQAISMYNGRVYGRVEELIFGSEKDYYDSALQYGGYWALSHAFKCFFLETAEVSNTDDRLRTISPLSDQYGLFMPRLVHAFHYLCGTEHLAVNGYPYPAFTILRNVFDACVLTSAVLQGLSDFYSIEGLVPGQDLDMKAAKKLRVNTEVMVRQKMTGVNSNLKTSTIEDLRILDELFDHEVHGARLSLAKNASWFKGEGLRIVPSFSGEQVKALFSRQIETEWMLHRLLPMRQPTGYLLPKMWAEKWNLLDESFAIASSNAKDVGDECFGDSMIEFINAKFPFNAKSTFPL